jgi:hypothetical protein
MELEMEHETQRALEKRLFCKEGLPVGRVGEI